jgi:hypothetical protein
MKLTMEEISQFDSEIAKYLQWEEVENPLLPGKSKKIWRITTLTSSPFIIEGALVGKPFLFSSSFDWLMAVVIKAETEDIGFKMCRKVVEVYVDSTKEVLFKVKEDSRLNSLYKAVVTFVKWHNEKK